MDAYIVAAKRQRIPGQKEVDFDLPVLMISQRM